MALWAPWTAIELSQVAAWVKQGWSAREIGRRLGRTRNSVLGRLNRDGIQLGQPTGVPTWNQVKIKKLRRMDLAGYTAARIAEDLQMPEPKVVSKIASVRRNRAAARLRSANIAPSVREVRAARIAAAKPEQPIGVKFLDIDFGRQCHYVLGNPNGYNTLYCGVEVIPEQPYCAAHCRLCYNIAA